MHYLVSDEKKQEIVDYLENASLYEELECNGKKYVLAHAGLAAYCFETELFTYVEGAKRY